MLKVGVRIAVATILLLGSLFFLSRCGEEECLVSGENCASSYKRANYGTTNIYCCEPMNCVQNHLNDSVCR